MKHLLGNQDHRGCEQRDSRAEAGEGAYGLLVKLMICLKRQQLRLQERQREVASLQAAKDDLFTRLESFKRDLERTLQSTKVPHDEIEQTKSDVGQPSSSSINGFLIITLRFATR